MIVLIRINYKKTHRHRVVLWMWNMHLLPKRVEDRCMCSTSTKQWSLPFYWTEQTLWDILGVESSVEVPGSCWTLYGIYTLLSYWRYSLFPDNPLLSCYQLYSIWLHHIAYCECYILWLTLLEHCSAPWNPELPSIVLKLLKKRVSAKHVEHWALSPVISPHDRPLSAQLWPTSSAGDVLMW